MKRNQYQDRRHFLRTLGGLALTGTLLPVMGAGNFLFAGNNSAEGLSLSESFTPGYLKLHRSGELKERGDALWAMLSRCRMCPRNCNINRLAGRRGPCNANADLEISSFAPHFGEERELVGTRGSGTIFMTNCSLLCVFCINYEVSQMRRGSEESLQEMATMMLTLQRLGCHNINFVTPTHYTAHILKALDIAAARGLTLPVVWNSSGWENMNVIRQLDGIVDVYLPDFKFYTSEASNRFMPGAICYPETTKAAILEMHRQVGVPAIDANTRLITRGMMIRHLVMPNNVAHSDKIMEWIGENLPKNTYLNIMSQYTPVFKARQFPEINRRITRSEYDAVVNAARRAGLVNLRLQMRG